MVIKWPKHRIVVRRANDAAGPTSRDVYFNDVRRGEVWPCGDGTWAARGPEDALGVAGFRTMGNAVRYIVVQCIDWKESP